MDFVLAWQAVVLGIVEGITEYLPVSSTGHLIVIGKMISFEPAFAETFEVFIQLGGIFAVVLLYQNRFLGFLPNAPQQGAWSGRAGLMRLAVTSCPALVLGALFHKHIKALLFSPLPVAFALVFGALIMLLVERRERIARVTSLDQLTLRECFLVGLFQCFALWPGMSRSGSTIVGGMLLGLERRVAAEFSFIVAVPLMCAAVGFDLLKSYKTLTVAAIPIFAIGFVVSFLCAVVAIRSLVAILGRWTLAPFAYYRIALAAGIVVWVNW